MWRPEVSAEKFRAGLGHSGQANRHHQLQSGPPEFDQVIIFLTIIQVSPGHKARGVLVRSSHTPLQLAVSPLVLGLPK